MQQLDPANVAQGQRYAEVRRHYGKTQHQLGQDIGVSHQQISKIERGQSKLAVQQLRRTAKCLGCSTTALLNPQGSPLPERNKRRRRKTDPPDQPKPEIAVIALLEAAAEATVAPGR